MASLIEFPAKKVATDSLPEPDDAYEAYGLAQQSTPPMIVFVHADGAMTAFPYADLSFGHFEPLGTEDGGECAIHMVFGSKMPEGGAAKTAATESAGKVASKQANAAEDRNAG